MNIIVRKEKMTLVDDKREDAVISTFIEKLANKELRSIESIKKGTRNVLNTSRSCPLYISDKILLMPISVIRNDDATYINYYEIEKFYFREYSTVVLFKNQKMAILNITKYRFKCLFKKAKEIDDYMNNRNQICSIIKLLNKEKL